MPFILEASKNGIPLISIDIPIQHWAQWDRWIQTLISQPDLPDILHLFTLFDGFLHLPVDDENIIINDAHHVLGQEIQEFIGSLLAAQNRQSQIWTNLNAAAAAEHRREILAQADRNARQREHMVIVWSDKQNARTDATPSARPCQASMQITVISETVPLAPNIQIQKTHRFPKLVKLNHLDQHGISPLWAGGRHSNRRGNRTIP